MRLAITARAPGECDCLLPEGPDGLGSPSRDKFFDLFTLCYAEKEGEIFAVLTQGFPELVSMILATGTHSTQGESRSARMPR